MTRKKICYLAFLFLIIVGVAFCSYRVNAENEPSSLSSSEQASSLEEISVLDEDLQLSLTLSAPIETIRAGETGAFNLEFKVTGSQTSYQNVDLTVALPTNGNFEQSGDLESLSIANVVPTYDDLTGILSYHFDELKGGFTGIVALKVATVNGSTPNGLILNASATLKADNLETPKFAESDISVTSGPISDINKVYSKTLDSHDIEKSAPPQKGDSGLWEITVRVTKTTYGFEYLEPGSTITVVDNIPAGLGYVEDDSGGIYNQQGNTMTWNFTAPTLAEQEQAANESDIFYKKIVLKVKFVETLNSLKKYTNVAYLILNSINNVPYGLEAKADIIADASNSAIPPTQGTLYYPSHWGPLNAQGNTTGNDNLGLYPTVTDSALLGFEYCITAMQASSSTKPFIETTSPYKIDDNLQLEYFRITRPYFRPHTNAIDMGYVSKDRVSFIVNVQYINKDGTTGSKDILLDGEYEPDKVYNIRDFFDGEVPHITLVTLDFSYRAAGTGIYAKFYCSVNEGYVGKVENAMGFYYKGYNEAGDVVSQSQSVNGPPIWQYSANRGAIVVPPAEPNNPTVANSISFLSNINGIVTAGNNTVGGSIQNTSVSANRVKGPYNTYVLLPRGVTLNTATTDLKLSYTNNWLNTTSTDQTGTIEIVNNNYLNKKRQLLHIHFDTGDPLAVNTQLNYEFNITIDNLISPPLLQPEAYSFIGNTEFNVPSVVIPSITDSTIEYDTNDLNNNGNLSEKYIKTGNTYRIFKPDSMEIKEEVKGDLDTSFSYFGHSKSDGEVTYRMHLVNTGTSIINTFVLMNVLPSTGALGITDNVSMGSKFTAELTGPIGIPDVWKDGMDIYYSTAVTPKRDVLNESAVLSSTPIPNPPSAEEPNWMTQDQVIDWSTIHSYYIKMKDNKVWNIKDSVYLDFSMKVPSNLPNALTNPNIPEIERATWNSFAFTANGLSPIEPERAGLVVNNDLFALDITKVDQFNTNAKLVGAEFTLYDAQQQELEKATTDENGLASFQDLTFGTYYIKETKTPNGYLPPGKMYEFEINQFGEIEIKNEDTSIISIEQIGDTGHTIKIEMGNTKQVLPNTGENSLFILLVIGALLGTLGCTYFIKELIKIK